MKVNEKNEKQYLDWYYRNFISVSKMHARLAWILLILSVFTLSADLSRGGDLEVPFFNVPMDINVLKIFLPLILSLIFWEFVGSLRAVRSSFQNILYRLKKLGYNWNELRIYDIDTELNFFDLITFNFQKYLKPGMIERETRFRLKHLPYGIFTMAFICLKIVLLVDFITEKDQSGLIYIVPVFILFIILDILFVLKLRSCMSLQ